jgi:hypothetical protein
VGLERSPLSLMSTIEELLERKCSESGLENRDYDRRGSAALTTRHLYQEKVALTSPTSGGRSVGIVRSRTQAANGKEFVESVSVQQFSVREMCPELSEIFSASRTGVENNLKD